jgi:uncharacterized membrane protein
VAKLAAQESRRTPVVPRGQRWQVILTVVVLVVLPHLVPAHLRLGPRWLSAALGAFFLAALLVAIREDAGRAKRVVRPLAIGFTVVLILVALWMTVRLIIDLIKGGPVTNSATVLLSTGALVWLYNVIFFGFLYWELDAGGPVDRALGAGKFPDFAFPQQMSPELAPPGWKPAFLDYLYVGLTGAMAFSPTDVMPLTPAAKLTLGTESLISLVVVGLVIARAINVLA